MNRFDRTSPYALAPGSDAWLVLQEQCCLADDGLEALLRILEPDEKLMYAASVTAEYAAVVGAGEDPVSVHGDLVGRREDTFASARTTVEALASFAPADDPEGRPQQRIPAVAYAEALLAQAQIDGRTDVTILPGLAGPPQIVDAAKMGHVCRPVTAATLETHAAMLNSSLPTHEQSPAMRESRRQQEDLMDDIADINERLLVVHTAVLEAMDVCFAGSDPGQLDREATAAYTDVAMLLASARLWQHLYPDPAQFACEPDWDGLGHTILRIGRIDALRARWRGFAEAPLTTSRQLAEIAVAASTEAEAAHLFDAQRIIAYWMFAEIYSEEEEGES